tara:strand:- start:258 stop:704 length:447 start_codon:yes stop_codon:yes gene_type:complete
MNTATLKNLLPNSKIRLKDDHLVLIVSLFYNHPKLLNEDAWTLLKVGSEQVLIDSDTLHVCGDKEIEFVWKKDHISHIRLTSNLTGQALDKHWEEMLAFSENVKREMHDHFDDKKVSELCDFMSDVKLSSPAQGRILEEEARVPQDSI